MAIDTREQTESKLKNLYEKLDEAIFHILEKLDFTYRQLSKNLTEEERAVYHRRYTWLSKYLRHYRLGEDCISTYSEDQ